MEASLGYTLGYVCVCCALAHNNGDSSGCEALCSDHSERLCEYGLDPGDWAVVAIEPDSIGYYTCAGCGDVNIGTAHEITIFPR